MANMPIRKYNSWLLLESEQVNPTTATQAPTIQSDPMAIDPNLPDPNAGVNDVPLIDVNQEGDDSQIEMSEMDRFDDIDTRRKDAIRAFKEKQKEFLAIPIETRNNPMSDEDSQKVKTLKDELASLNQTMKDVIAEYDAFNDEMLGINNEDIGDDEP